MQPGAGRRTDACWVWFQQVSLRQAPPFTVALGRGRTSCRFVSRCKLKMRGPWFENHEEFQDGGSNRAQNPAQALLSAGPWVTLRVTRPEDSLHRGQLGPRRSCDLLGAGSWDLRAEC